MIRSVRSIRFTPAEIEDLRALGIDISGVKSVDDFAAALEPWLDALAEVKPELFHKIGREIAALKAIDVPLIRSRSPILK